MRTAFKKTKTKQECCPPNPLSPVTTLISLYESHLRSLPPPSNVLQHYTPDAVITYIPTGIQHRGAPSIGRLMEQLRDLHWTVLPSTLINTTVDTHTSTITSESIIRLSHHKTIPWLLPTIKPTDADLTFPDGDDDGGWRCKEKRCYWDQLGLLRLLNVVPGSLFSRRLGCEVVMPVGDLRVVNEMLMERMETVVEREDGHSGDDGVPRGAPLDNMHKQAGGQHGTAMELEKRHDMYANEREQPVQVQHQQHAQQQDFRNGDRGRYGTSTGMGVSVERPSVRLHHAPGGKTSIQFG
ncbi:hypothetical protein BC829DRAFT_386058 [Chytridium lagenaria]|nr:hypothetical protein BC829DRAFT_386058 [Chytridium lagenaria]